MFLCRQLINKKPAKIPDYAAEKKQICVMLCYVMLCYVVSCHVMSCHVMSCHVMLCYVMLSYVVLFYVMLLCVMLCYVMLCCVVEMETNNMTNTWHLGEELPVFLLLG